MKWQQTKKDNFKIEDILQKTNFKFSVSGFKKYTITKCVPISLLFSYNYKDKNRTFKNKLLSSTMTKFRSFSLQKKLNDSSLIF